MCPVDPKRTPQWHSATPPCRPDILEEILEKKLLDARSARELHEIALALANKISATTAIEALTALYLPAWMRTRKKLDHPDESLEAKVRSYFPAGALERRGVMFLQGKPNVDSPWFVLEYVADTFIAPADDWQSEILASAIKSVAQERGAQESTKRRTGGRPQEEWSFCNLCWRLVPTRDNKFMVLCDKHRPKSAAYQKHRRVREMAKGNLERLHQLAGQERGMKFPPQGNVASWLVTHYPFTAEYINDRGGANSTIELVTCLDGDTNLRDPYKARETFHHVIAANRGSVYGLLLRSEAWLSALAERRHGGKRRGKRKGPKRRAKY